MLLLPASEHEFPDLLEKLTRQLRPLHQDCIRFYMKRTPSMKAILKSYGVQRTEFDATVAAAFEALRTLLSTAGVFSVSDVIGE